MPTAIATILDEHRSLAAVLHGLVFLVRQVRAGRMEPDLPLFSAMLRYIQDFPEKLHHPKEDEHLFRALRGRAPSAAAVLDELEGEHARGRELIATLSASLERYQRAEAGAAEEFARAAEAYAEFHWQHMRKEEDVLVPLAEQALTVEDWAAVDGAFRANGDPLADVDRRDLRELFRRIVHLAPPQIGVGPEGRS